MNLQELLDELRLNILHDRSDRSGGDTDYLWSDATLIRYIDEAQRRFARRSFVLRDSSTPECTLVTLKTGVSEYALHPSLISVLSAKYPTDRNDLARAGHSVLNAGVRATDNWDLSRQPLAAVGKPVAFATDEQVVMGDEDSSATISMRVFPTPDLASNNLVLRLRVVRSPIDRLTPASLSAVPEIPEDHHLEMLDWAAYLALRIVDDEAGSPKRAGDFSTTFESHVQEARKQVMRKLFAPKPWGFGRGGWAWGS